MRVPIFGEGTLSYGFSYLLLEPFRVFDFVYFIFGFRADIEDLAY